MKGLTKKQAQFCKTLAITPNHPTEAAIKAGYAPSIAKTTACQLIRNPKILAHIKTLTIPTENKLKENYDWKLEKLRQIVTSFIPREASNLESKEVAVAIHAIAEMNKMQGHYAAEKQMNLHVNVDNDMAQLETLIKQYRKDF